MQMLGSLQGILMLAIVVGIFALSVASLISSLLYTDEMYRAADRKSKKFWSLILVAAAVVAFLALPPLGGGRLGFLSIAGLVAAAVYWLDVRPRLRQVDPRRRGR
ncbi:MULTISPECIES: DUF2516 family protein [Brevibacterium]|jgi:hypothetical protein|uniref:DUF2516 family protein n=1 Tax=Brevibacterium salitolerans TaxID=1403566 RepID=A0ABN2WII0_9MICO|nr:DUF2516 family protein [Brevibacterium sp.]